MDGDEVAPLSAAGVVRYLIGVGLLDAALVVRGKVRVEERSRRNLNFLVHCGEGGLFVKQGLGVDKRLSVGAEAAAYRMLADFESLGKYLVRARHFDPVRAIQVLSLVPSATSLRDHHVRTRHLPLMAARHLARALAHLHNGGLAGDSPAQLRRAPAEALSIHRPTTAAVDVTSRAGRAVISMIQAAPGFGDALDSASGEWRCESVIHGDVRWDNCLVFGLAGSARRTRLKLVDWELARVGDPAWDLGSVFAEYLAAWTASLPASAEVPPDRVLAAARMPVERIHRPVRTFWDSYCDARIGDDDLRALRLRAVRYAGCRLVQTGFERADRSTRVPTQSVICLQLGLNLLTRSREAAAHLLALDLGRVP